MADRSESMESEEGSSEFEQSWLVRRRRRIFALRRNDSRNGGDSPLLERLGSDGIIHTSERQDSSSSSESIRPNSSYSSESSSSSRAASSVFSNGSLERMSFDTTSSSDRELLAREASPFAELRELFEGKSPILDSSYSYDSNASTIEPAQSTPLPEAVPTLEVFERVVLDVEPRYPPERIPEIDGEAEIGLEAEIGGEAVGEAEEVRRRRLNRRRIHANDDGIEEEMGIPARRRRIADREVIEILLGELVDQVAERQAAEIEDRMDAAYGNSDVNVPDISNHSPIGWSDRSSERKRKAEEDSENESTSKRSKNDDDEEDSDGGLINVPLRRSLRIRYAPDRWTYSWDYIRRYHRTRRQATGKDPSVVRQRAPKVVLPVVPVPPKTPRLPPILSRHIPQAPAPPANVSAPIPIVQIIMVSDVEKELENCQEHFEKFNFGYDTLEIATLLTRTKNSLSRVTNIDAKQKKRFENVLMKIRKLLKMVD